MRAAAAAVLSLLALQTYPPPFPRENGTKHFENERVVIWEGTFLTGRPTPMHEHRLDAVGIFLTDGQIKATLADGTVRVGQPFSAGHVVYGTRGVTHIEEGLLDGIRVVVIEFKEPPPAAGSVVAAAAAKPLPRGDAKLRVDNERVAVWDLQWSPDQIVPPHIHDRDVIVVPFQDGQIRYVGSDGQARVERLTTGKPVYHVRGESHQSESVERPLRAIQVELK